MIVRPFVLLCTLFLSLILENGETFCGALTVQQKNASKHPPVDFSQSPTSNSSQLCKSPAKNCSPPITRNTWTAGANLQAQAEKNSAIFLATMFSKDCLSDPQGASAKGIFLQRLFFLVSQKALCSKTKTATMEQPPQKCEMPVALMLGQEGRILIEADGIPAAKILNWLLSGSPEGRVSFLKNRSIASHDLEQTKNGHLKEVNLKGFGGAFENIENSLMGRHKYVNIPLGGIGNTAPITCPCGLKNPGILTQLRQKIFPSKGTKKPPPPAKQSCSCQCLIGSEGLVYQTKTKKYLPRIQHGHVYIFIQDFEAPKTKTLQGGLLIGLESSAPGKKGFFSSGGAYNISSSRTAMGGRKGTFLNGIVIQLNPDDFKQLQEGFQKIAKTPENFEKLLMSYP